MGLMAGMAGIEPTSQVLETCLRPSLTPRLKSATNALFGKEVLKNWLDLLALKQNVKFRDINTGIICTLCIVSCVANVGNNYLQIK